MFSFNQNKGNCNEKTYRKTISLHLTTITQFLRSPSSVTMATVHKLSPGMTTSPEESEPTNRVNMSVTTIESSPAKQTRRRSRSLRASRLANLAPAMSTYIIELPSSGITSRPKTRSGTSSNDCSDPQDASSFLNKSDDRLTNTSVRSQMSAKEKAEHIRRKLQMVCERRPVGTILCS